MKQLVSKLLEKSSSLDSEENLEKIHLNSELKEKDEVELAHTNPPVRAESTCASDLQSDTNLIGTKSGTPQLLAPLGSICLPLARTAKHTSKEKKWAVAALENPNAQARASLFEVQEPYFN